jgi:hypothetical protein
MTEPDPDELSFDEPGTDADESDSPEVAPGDDEA